MHVIQIRLSEGFTTPTVLEIADQLLEIQMNPEHSLSEALDGSPIELRDEDVRLAHLLLNDRDFKRKFEMNGETLVIRSAG